MLVPPLEGNQLDGEDFVLADRMRYLILMTPRIAALVAALHEPAADAPALFARFDSRLLT